MSKEYVIIPKVWRSEIKAITLFVILSLLSIYLSNKFPASVIRGPIFEFENYGVYLWLPLWWLIPAVVLILTIIRIYNVRYKVDQRGIEMRLGILSFHQRINRLRFEDIRNIEIEQTIVQRVLNTGRVEVSTAATGTIEIIMEGIAAPNEVRSMLEREREVRQKNHNRKLYNAGEKKDIQKAEQASG